MPVDSEIIILVDGQTFSQAGFDFILEGVAQAFEQQSFIDSVASGSVGSIAASVSIFNSTGTSTAIPWIELSSASDLQGFADSVRDVALPPSFGPISYVDAISSAAASIATSATEGALRQVTIVEDGSFFFFDDTAAEIRAERDAALASSADVINAVVFNAAGAARTAAIDDFYTENVVGGEPGGEVDVIGGSFFGAPASPVIAEAIQSSIVATITQPTVDAGALTVVPESSTAFLGVFSLATLMVRRRRC